MFHLDTKMGIDTNLGNGSALCGCLGFCSHRISPCCILGIVMNPFRTQITTEQRPGKLSAGRWSELGTVGCVLLQCSGLAVS